MVSNHQLEILMNSTQHPTLGQFICYRNFPEVSEPHQVEPSTPPDQQGIGYRPGELSGTRSMRAYTLENVPHVNKRLPVPNRIGKIRPVCSGTRRHPIIGY